MVTVLLKIYRVLPRNFLVGGGGGGKEKSQDRNPVTQNGGVDYFKLHVSSVEALPFFTGKDNICHFLLIICERK